MKLEKEIIDQIENSDAYYIIGVKGETNFSSIGGKYSDDTETIHHIVQGMLGSVNEAINSKKAGNAWILMVLIAESIKRFPQFMKLTK